MRNRSLPSVIASAWCLGLGGCLSAALNNPISAPGMGGPEPAFAIGGTLRGAQGALTLQNSNGTQLNVAANGAFRFETPMVTSAWYHVTVAVGPRTQACRVTNGSGTVGHADVDNVFITCE